MAVSTAQAAGEKKPRVNLKYMRDKDREMVKGIFRFFEVPGGSMSFVFHAYREDPVERYDFIDGQLYTIPLGVARHLNKNGWYPTYEYIKGEDGVQGGFGPSNTMRVGQKNRRFGFQSLEFIDHEDLSTQVSPIVTVEHV